jgi:hypothetical protein
VGKLEATVRKYLLQLVLGTVLVSTGFFLVNTSLNTPIQSDESAFVSVSLHPLQTTMNVDWVAQSDSSTRSTQWVQEVWGFKYWTHPPVIPILLYPFTSVVSNIYLLRLLPIVLFLIAELLIIDIVRRKTTRWGLTLFIPFLLMFLGYFRSVPYFYYDIFQVFLFVVSWWLIDRKSNWKYLSIALLVVSKSTGPLYLIPLILKDKNWKLVLTVIPFAVYYLGGVLRNQDILWWFHYWVTNAKWVHQDLVNGYRMNWITTSIEILIPVIVLILGIRRYKENLPEMVSLTIALLIAYTWNGANYAKVIVGITCLLIIASLFGSKDMEIVNAKMD